MLEQRDRDTIRQLFAGAERPVRIAVLNRDGEGTEFAEVVEELRAVIPTLDVEARTWTEDDRVLAEEAPAIVLLDADGGPTGARFLGYPVGYEFAAFIQDLADMAHGRSELAPATTAALAELSQDVFIQVFTTPT